jgi:hypothetical protein
MRDQKTKHQRDEGRGVARRVIVHIQMTASAIVVLSLLSPAQAAVFNVAAGDVAGLISAINTANGNNEDDTINLAAGTYTLTAVNNDTDGSNGLPSITTALTIHGAGANGTVLAKVASAPAFRIVHVAATGIVTLEGLTATGAFFPLTSRSERPHTARRNRCFLCSRAQRGCRYFK